MRTPPALALSLALAFALGCGGGGARDGTVTEGAPKLDEHARDFRFAALKGEHKGYLLDLWAPGDGTAWIVGDVILRVVDGAFERTELPVQTQLQSVWGASANDVWAVGTAGTILHYDGAAWTSVASPTKSPLYVVWGTKQDDLWAAGGKGTILKGDGKKWSLVAEDKNVKSKQYATVYNAFARHAKQDALVVVGSAHWDNAPHGVVTELSNGMFGASAGVSTFFRMHSIGGAAFTRDGALWALGASALRVDADKATSTPLFTERIEFKAVSATSTGEIWAAANSHSVPTGRKAPMELWHLDATSTWSRVDGAQFTDAPAAIFAASPDEVWILAQRAGEQRQRGEHVIAWVGSSTGATHAFAQKNASTSAAAHAAVAKTSIEGARQKIGAGLSAEPEVTTCLRESPDDVECLKLAFLSSRREPWIDGEARRYRYIEKAARDPSLFRVLAVTQSATSDEQLAWALAGEAPWTPLPTTSDADARAGVELALKAQRALDNGYVGDGDGAKSFGADAERDLLACLEKLDHPQCHYMLVALYATRDDVAKAQQHAERYAALRPATAEATRVAAYAKGRDRPAHEFLRAALSVEVNALSRGAFGGGDGIPPAPGEIARPLSRDVRFRVTSIEPPTAKPGDVITLHGSGFPSTKTIKKRTILGEEDRETVSVIFRGTMANTLDVQPTAVRIRVPAFAASGRIDISVEGDGGATIPFYDVGRKDPPRVPGSGRNGEHRVTTDDPRVMGEELMIMFDADATVDDIVRISKRVGTIAHEIGSGHVVVDVPGATTKAALEKAAAELEREKLVKLVSMNTLISVH